MQGFLKRLPAILFIVSLMALAFGYGYLSHWTGIFPHRLLQEAKMGLKSILYVYKDLDTHLGGVAFRENSDAAGPAAVTKKDGAGEELIFVLGNENTLPDHCPETGCLAWLMNRKGEVLHVWKHHPDLWKPLKGRESLGGAWRSYPVGAHLYPNGDILVSYQGRNVFPIPMGLAKFDKDSNLLWKNDGYYHHWFDVDDQGNIYVPDTRVAKSPLRFPDHREYVACEKEFLTYEPLAILDPDGNHIGEIDLLQALLDSDLKGVFHAMHDSPARIETCDPLHLNDVRILRPEFAGGFPKFEAGDLLLSFRTLNGVGVLDPDTRRFKWFYSGGMHHQHSPRYLKDNRLLVFDNLGGAKSRGVSRVVSIDAGGDGVSVVFPPGGEDVTDKKFNSNTAGHIDLEREAGRMLVSWTHQGLIWEIDIESGEVLWEYVNTHKLSEGYGRIPVYTALYVDDVDFPYNARKTN